MNQFQNIANSVYRNWHIRSTGGTFDRQIHSARAGDLNKAIFKNSNAAG